MVAFYVAGDKIIIYYLLSKVSQTLVKFQDDKRRLKLLIWSSTEHHEINWAMSWENLF